MDENKFLQLIKKDGLLGILIALLVYFGTALQTAQGELSKQLTNIKLKLVEMENKVKFKLKPVCISYDLAEAIYNKCLILECE